MSEPVYSINTYTGNGATASFSVSFPYILDAHVLVTVDSQVVAYSFTTPSQITFSVAPANNALVVFRRRTPADALLAIVQGKSVLKSAELNLVYTQLLYIMQESFDIANLLEGSTIEIAAALLEIQNSLAELRLIAAWIAYQYDAIFSIPFRPSNGEILGTLPVVRGLKLVSAGAGGSRAYTDGQSTGTSSIVSIQKNGVEVGTVTFAADAATGTFSIPSDVTFADADRLSLRCTTATSTFRDFAVTLKLRRVI